MAETKTVRAIERAIRVLRYIQSHAPTSLEEIHQAIDLPRSTTARILLTLQLEGMIRRGFVDGLYRNSILMFGHNTASKFIERLAEASAPLMEELCRQTGWPSDLMARSGLHMELVETTRSLSLFPMSPARLGERVILPTTGVGRAYLAFCPEPELTLILEELEEAGAPIDSFYQSRQAFDREMRAIREIGYADRHNLSRGQTSLTGANYDDGLSAIAIPIMDGKAVAACLNMIWNRRLATPSEMANDHLERLKYIAEQAITVLNERRAAVGR
jgi:IclR family mhp operon transcriptional activator